MNYFLPAGFAGAGAGFLGAGLAGVAIVVSPFIGFTITDFKHSLMLSFHQ